MNISTLPLPGGVSTVFTSNPSDQSCNKLFLSKLVLKNSTFKEGLAMKHIVCIFAFLFFSASGISAQWTSLKGPFGCWANGFYSEGDTIYSTTSTSYTSKTYRSTDGGHIWNPLDFKLPENIFYQKILYKKGNIVFVELETADVGTVRLFFSRNNGMTFDLLLDSAVNYSVLAVADTIFVTRSADFWSGNDTTSLIRSSDNGKTWTTISPHTHLSLSKLQYFAGALYALKSKNDDWQICRSFDGGKTWDSLFGKTRADFINSMPHLEDFVLYSIPGDSSLWLVIDSTATNDNIFQRFLKISLDGSSVKTFPFPTKNSNPSIDTVITNLIMINGYIYATTSFDIYKYVPEQKEWNVLTNNILRASVDRITNFLPLPQQGSNEILISFDKWSRWNSGYTNGVYRFSAGRSECIPSDTGMNSTETNRIFVFNDTVFSLTPGNGYPLYTSADQGDSWDRVSFPFDIHGYDILALVETPKGLLYSNRDSIFLRKRSDAQIITNYIGRQILSFLPMGDALFCRTGNEFFRSDDSGVTWIKLTQPPLMTTSGIANTVFKKLMLVGGDSIIISSDGCLTWKKVNGIPYSMVCNCLASDGNNIYAGATCSEGNNSFYGFFRSTDEGQTWNLFLPKMQGRFGFIFPLKDKLLFGGLGGVFRCNIDGSGIVELFKDQHMKQAYAIANDSEYVYIGTAGYGLFRAKIKDVLQYADAVSPRIQFKDISFQVFPNPSTRKLSLQYILPNSSSVILKITNSIGTEMGSKDFGIQNGGVQSINYDGTSLPNGVYFATLIAGKNTQTISFIVGKK